MQKTPLYKRCLATVMTLCLLVLPAFSLAESYQVVKGGRLNLRQSASLTAEVLGQYPTGTWMTVVEKGDEWTKVTVDGKTGYVMSKYLADPAQSDATRYVRTNTGIGLNLRSAPSLTGTIVTSFKPGTEVTVIAQSDGWAQVKIGEQVGYMSSRFLATKATSGSVSGYPKTGVVANPGANQVLLLRETASTDARVIGYYGNGVTVKLVSESGDFYKVTVDGKAGYMMKKFVKVTSSEAPAETPFTAKLINPNGNAIVNFRAQPGLNGSIIKAYPVGTEIKVLEYGANWSKCEIDGTQGYVSSYFFKK